MAIRQRTRMPRQVVSVIAGAVVLLCATGVVLAWHPWNTTDSALAPRYPTATLIREGRTDATIAKGTRVGPTTTRLYGVAAGATTSANSIIAWYHDRLKEKGWQFQNSDALFDFTSREAWMMNCNALYVGVYRPEYLRTLALPAHTSAYTLVYVVHEQDLCDLPS